MLADDLASARVREAKEKMLLETWKKFTEGMILPSSKRTETNSKGVESGFVKEKVVLEREVSISEGVKGKIGLERGPSTPKIIRQGDVKTLKDGVKSPVGMGTSHTKNGIEKKKVKITKVMVETGLEAEPSTAGTTLKDEIETPIWMETPTGQTVFHEGSETSKERKAEVFELSKNAEAKVSELTETDTSKETINTEQPK